MQSVAVFWDYENCPAPSNASGYATVNCIRALAQTYGVIKSLRAYTGISEQFSATRAQVLRSELQCSGVSLIDCPHNGRKDVADKMMIVDMLAHAIDHCPSSTVIFLISGDRDFAYAMSILRLRCYNIVLCAPNNAHCSLLAQASVCIDWASVALSPDSPNQPSSNRQLYAETNRSTSHTFIPPTPHFRGSVNTLPPFNDVGILPSPSTRHVAKHSASFSSDSGSSTSESFRPRQDNGHKSTNDQMRYSRQNSFNSSHDNNRQVRAAYLTPTSSSPDKSADAEVASNPSINMTSSVLAGNTVPPAKGQTTHVLNRATPESSSPEPSTTEIKESTMPPVSYQLPITTPLVVNESSAAPSSVHQSAFVPSPNLNPEPIIIPPTVETSSGIATPTMHEVAGYINNKLSASVDETATVMPPSAHLPSSNEVDVDTTASESSVTSESAYATAASKSAPSSPAAKSPPLTSSPAPAPAAADPEASGAAAPTRPTPPAHFKPLVRILQVHRARGILKPTRSQVALQVGQPANGNPYKQVGVERWAQYAELAKKAGIIELGGREAAAWVSLTPKWYDALAK